MPHSWGARGRWCKHPGRGARQRLACPGFASAALALGSGGISPGLAIASLGAGSRFLTSFAVALSHTNWGQGSCVASVPSSPLQHLGASIVQKVCRKADGARVGKQQPCGQGSAVRGTGRSPWGTWYCGGDPPAGCKAGAQTCGCLFGAWMRFRWWRRGQLRTCKLSASLGKPMARAGSEGEGSSKDSGCNTLSPSPQTSFKTLRRALTLHLPSSPAGIQQCSAGEQRDTV